MKKVNYHTHNERCKHAYGSVFDYAAHAYKEGFSCIGFSDHAPFPNNPYGFRMDFEELDAYIKDVNLLKQEYENKMDILLGFEIEYLPAYSWYYKKLFQEYHLDYLILGQHFFADEKNREHYVYDAQDTKEFVAYAHSIKDALKTGFFSFIAHPDLMFVHDFPWDDNCEEACDIIIAAAKANHIPIELNANGIRRGLHDTLQGSRYDYPHWRFFEKVARETIPVIINSDCHEPAQLSDYAITKAFELAADWNLTLVDSVPLPVHQS